MRSLQPIATTRPIALIWIMAHSASGRLLMRCALSDEMKRPADGAWGCRRAVIGVLRS